MKKILILLILSALLLTSLVACKKEDTPDVNPPVSEDSGKDTEDVSNDTEDNGNDTENIDENVNLPKLDPPSDEIIEEIKKSWYEQRRETVEWVPERNYFRDIGIYYGTYNGYVIIVSKGMASIVCPIYIGNEFFYFGSSTTIFAYKDGVFDKLRRVYEEGNISDEQLAEIAQYHKDIHLPDNYEWVVEVANAYISQSGRDDIERKDLELWVYNEFDDICVLYVLNNKDYNDDDYKEVHPQTIGGLTFQFQFPPTLEVYFNGFFYSLQEAFDAKIISSEQLKQVYDNYHDEYAKIEFHPCMSIYEFFE